MNLEHRTSLALLAPLLTLVALTACASTSSDSKAGSAGGRASGGAQPSTGASGEPSNGGAGNASGGSSGAPSGGSAGSAGSAAASGNAGTADAAGSAPVVDTAWLGRPPAVPLIVRTPYLSTWSAADSPNAVWPSFWDGGTKAITGIARIDGAPFVFLGAPNVAGSNQMVLSSRSLTPTKTEFVLSAGGVALTLDFLSPVEPTDLKRQSAPLGYVTVRALGTDGKAHAVSVYFDISGEWAHGDSTQPVVWARETVPHQGGNLVVQSVAPATPQPLTEVNQYPSWGTAFIAAEAGATTTAAIGPDSAVRALAATSGKLDGSLDSNMPRAINDNWPVLGLAFDLGQVSSAATTPVTLLIGHARDPAVSYLGKAVSPLWKSYWPTWQAMVADEFDDAAGAATRAAALDAQVVTDATAAGGEHYSALCALSLRQAFGGTELVGTEAKPWLMLKEISSDGNVSTVDVVFPASPAFLYTSPLLLKLMLDPLLDYAETGGWPKPFAEHDLGSAYPNAAGHNDGNEEDMPIEESADMLLMMAAYAQHASAADGKAFASAHYAIAKQWADYLLPNTLDPQNQNQTDDFTGFINHSVNLALKGIVGVGAMSILADFAGKTADQASYLSQAQALAAQWATQAQDASGTHLLLEYDKPGSWSLKYNALYDKILGLNLVPAAISTEEAAWYAAQAQAYGVQLDPRNSYTKSDWEIWTAASLSDRAVQKTLIDGVYAYATTSTARVPFGDLYYTGTGQWDAFSARPVQGGMFALLALKKH
ncbi:MAG TPA: DUF4965 domain-containing protein [Polyangiaceae bacterium]|jgi:hypothetical protein|nr:DUF4965 domain-containing protein [Polyangiaceae bacterium]